MILNISAFALVACVGCLHSVSGASFSKVYVSSGQEVVPLEYIQYGGPAVSMPGPQIAQISAAPIGSIIPVASSPNLIPPCNTPCVLSGPAIPSVAQVAAATPNFVTYKSNVPAVVTNNEELTGYEYSYVVYDENTGDHKAQRESSDGAVVKGEYSLIQPDGYVREVHYTADDLNGFNAVVKNFLPTQVESKDDHKENNQPAQPCHEDKNISLESSENGVKHDIAHDPEPQDEHQHQETHEAAASHETQAVKTSAKAPESSSSEESHEIIKDEQQTNPIETHEKKSEALTKGPPESSEEGESSDEDSVEELKSEPPHDELGPTTHEEQKTEEHTEHQFNEKPYHDIIKCVQTAISAKDKFPSPLTYIIFNKPC